MTTEDRFWSKVERRGPNDCWPWRAGMRRGYGRFWVSAADRVEAHRYAYELAAGPIPDGLTIDHLCRNRGCVNPGHLEPVTNAENVRRGFVAVPRPPADVCPRGHAYTPENTRLVVRSDREHRLCRTCTRMRGRDAYRRTRVLSDTGERR